MGFIDTRAVNKKFKVEFDEFLDNFEDCCQSCSAIQIKSQKYKYLDLMERNSRVIDMIGRHS